MFLCCGTCAFVSVLCLCGVCISVMGELVWCVFWWCVFWWCVLCEFVVCVVCVCLCVFVRVQCSCLCLSGVCVYVLRAVWSFCGMCICVLCVFL